MISRKRYKDVYIVKGLSGECQGLYKIGITASGRLDSRLKELQDRFGPIKLVMVIRSAAFERKLHEIFSDKQTTVSGSKEWFRINHSDLVKIFNTASMECLLEWVDHSEV